MRLAILIPCITVCTGCASQLTAFYNRSVVEDNIGGIVSTVSLSADRRTVIVAPDAQKKPLYCAEPPPDTATGLKTDLEASAKSKGTDILIKDKIGTSVTVLSARNAPLDAFRTGLFSLCQFYMNGAVDQKDISKLFEMLIETYKITQPAGTATAAAIAQQAASAPK